MVKEQKALDQRFSRQVFSMTTLTWHNVIYFRFEESMLRQHGARWANCWSIKPKPRNIYLRIHFVPKSLTQNYSPESVGVRRRLIALKATQIIGVPSRISTPTDRWGN